MSNMLLMLVLCMLLSGCGFAPVKLGKAEYHVRPFERADGTLACCTVDVRNGKDYDALQVQMTRDVQGNITFTLNESGVSASDPASVQARQNAEMLKLLNHFLDRLPTAAAAAAPR